MRIRKIYIPYKNTKEYNLDMIEQRKEKKQKKNGILVARYKFLKEKKEYIR